MDTRSTASPPVSVARPLLGSLLATGLAVLLICGPPRGHLQSWGQLFTLATLYLMLAALVHTLAVWGVCRVLGRDSAAVELPQDARLIWPLVWVAWIAVVWLPLLALLAKEHSLWVALIEPLTIVFIVLLLRWNSLLEEEPEAGYVSRELFQIEETPALWRVLWPAVMVAVSFEVGPGLMAGGYVWLAGCVFTGGLLALLQLWSRWFRALAFGPESRTSRRAAAGNSLAVWMLIAMALVPFLAHGYASGLMRDVIAIRTPVVKPVTSKAGLGTSSGYPGIILVQPPKPHEMVAPVPAGAIVTLGKPKEITFDGAYWYLKVPDSRPGKDALVAHGDPISKNIFSTDWQPLVMEAHQPLGRPLLLRCCRAIKVMVKNADNVPGTISLEVKLRDTSSPWLAPVSLGVEVLPSSEVSPMPLHRAPVEETMSFAIPRTTLRMKSFNEITVRIKPERERSKAGAKVAIESFVLQP